MIFARSRKCNHCGVYCGGIDSLAALIAPRRSSLLPVLHGLPSFAAANRRRRLDYRL